MTKVFVDTNIGLLYRLEMDNCHFKDQIGFAKELLNIFASIQQFFLESYCFSTIGIVKRTQLATFLFCRFGKTFSCVWNQSFQFEVRLLICCLLVS